MVVDLLYPNEEERERSLIDRVNDHLKGSDSDETKITIQDIAGKLGMGAEQLSMWAGMDEEFQKGLVIYIEAEQNGVFDQFDNRANASILAVLLSEVKKKHKP